MKVGDLVRHSRWPFPKSPMGVVVESAKKRLSGNMMMFRVHWFVFDHEFNGWYGAHKLEVIHEGR